MAFDTTTQDWLVDRWDDVAAWAENARAWLADHVVDLVVVATLLLIVALGVFWFIDAPRYREEQIRQCVYLFEYTHDQCEFMVRNRIAP